MKRKFTPVFLNVFYFLCTLPLCTEAFAQGEWHVEESVNASAPIARHENGFVECNGKLYLLGGRRLGVDKFVNIYDPVAKVWTQGSKPDIELHHFQAVSYNNLIYIIGAFTGNYPDEVPVDKIYIYDPASDLWSSGITIPADRRRGSAGVAVYNGKIYIVGGIVNGHNSGYVNWLDVYNPADNSWTPLQNAPHPRDHFHAAVINNKLVLAGGRTTSLATNHLNDLVVPEVDVYDFATQTWGTYPNNIPTPRGGTTSVVLGEEVIVIGGEGPLSASLAHAQTEALNINTQTWRNFPALNTGRHGTQATVFNQKIYITAGSSQKGGSSATQLASLEVFSSSSVQSVIKKVEMNLACYPNPFHDQIHLSMEEKNNHLYAIKIYDMFGQCVKETSIHAPSEIDLATADLTSGTYYLNIHDTNKNVQQTVKIVKK